MEIELALYFSFTEKFTQLDVKSCTHDATF